MALQSCKRYALYSTDYSQPHIVAFQPLGVMYEYAKFQLYGTAGHGNAFISVSQSILFKLLCKQGDTPARLEYSNSSSGFVIHPPLPPKSE